MWRRGSAHRSESGRGTRLRGLCEPGIKDRCYAWRVMSIPAWRGLFSPDRTGVLSRSSGGTEGRRNLSVCSHEGLKASLVFSPPLPSEKMFSVINPAGERKHCQRAKVIIRCPAILDGLSNKVQKTIQALMVRSKDAHKFFWQEHGHYYVRLY